MRVFKELKFLKNFNIKSLILMIELLTKKKKSRKYF